MAKKPPKPNPHESRFVEEDPMNFMSFKLPEEISDKFQDVDDPEDDSDDEDNDDTDTE